MNEQTVIHEAGHGLVWLLEEKLLGRLGELSVLPCAGSDTLGRARGEDPSFGLRSRQAVRALGRVLAAGAVGEALAGYDPKGHDHDVEALGRIQRLSQNDRFMRESLVGAELLLRNYWASVQRIAGLLRRFGTLTPPHGIELARMQLTGPVQPLDTSLLDLNRMLLVLENVPEMRDMIADGLAPFAPKLLSPPARSNASKSLQSRCRVWTRMDAGRIDPGSVRYVRRRES